MRWRNNLLLAFWDEALRCRVYSSLEYMYSSALPTALINRGFYGGMWVASVEEVAVKIFEPSFDVAVQGAQAVDS